MYCILVTYIYTHKYILSLINTHAFMSQFVREFA